MLQLHRGTNRGVPLTPVQTMCLALNHFGGGHFQRVTGYCGNVSQNAAFCAIERVRQKLVELKAEFIRLPTVAEMEATAARIEERFQLPNFAYGIDGMPVRFDEAIRGIPVGPGFANLQNYRSRKGYYCINVLYVANDQHLILAFDRDWHGAAHDARIWTQSLFKPLIEAQPRFLLAGDSAFPISNVLVKPFSNAEAEVDARKRLFNKRHSGLRTVMTENTFGIMTKRFPILKKMRSHYQNAKETIDATAVLHNISILLHDDVPVEVVRPDPDVVVVPPVAADDLQEEFVPENVRRAAIRQQGRDNDVLMML